MSFGIPVRNGVMLGLTASTALTTRGGFPVPALSLNFLSGTLDSRITFTRALNTATRVNSSGIIETVNANIPRFDYDPVTLQPRGLIVEEQRTNLLLNSAINGANLPTQNVTVTAAIHTISFYGTGSITLSGAHSAIVNGAGAYPTRTTLTFTPTAGSLTCTVSGNVQFANLEVGSFATSFIPTVASTVVRNADVATMTGTNFSSWYRQTQGTFLAVFDTIAAAGAANIWVLAATDSTPSGRITIGGNPATSRGFVFASAATQADMLNGPITNNAIIKSALAYATNNFAFSTNGLAPTTDVSGTLPTPDRLTVGQFNGTYLNGRVRQIAYYSTRFPNTTIPVLTA